MEAVRHDGWALEYATKELQGDRMIVMEAVRQDGSSLRYATEVIAAKESQGRTLKK